MKHVHEVYHDIQVGGGGHAFSQGPEPKEYKGGYAHVVITCKGMFEAPEPAIYIEGTLDAIQSLAEQLTNFCKSLDAVMRDQHEREKPRSQKSEG